MDWTHYSIRDRQGREVHRVGATSDESWQVWCKKRDPEGDYSDDGRCSWNEYYMVRVWMKETKAWYR